MRIAGLVLALWTVRSSCFAPSFQISCQPRRYNSGLLYKSNSDDEQASTTPAIVSPVLRNVYPELQQYMQVYGHPNIPLGCSAGRNCVTLRRLRTQGKLTESDIELLDSMKFTWHSLEDVYEQQKDHFDDLYDRLLAYGEDLSPPKKYKADPELGAWVTALRRMHRVGQVDDEHVQRLDAVGFQWISPRQCGSKFMIQYREILERLQTESKETVLLDPTVVKWIKAQQNQHDALSETRKQYIGEMLGAMDWKSWSPDDV